LSALPLRKTFLALGARNRPPAFTATGYYHFLGRGDTTPGQPLSRWKLPQWEKWFDAMAAAGHNRVWLLVNGYTLAWPSAAYPALVDPDAACGRDTELLGRVVRAAKTRGLRTLAVFTADGHAEGMAKLHPELRAVARDGTAVSDDLVCLEEPEVQAWIQKQYEEVWALCQDWDGVVFHPTETSPLRFNAATAAVYQKETGRELAAETDEVLWPWFNLQWARFAARGFRWWQARRPGGEAIMFNCSWTNDHAAVYAKELPAIARICVWDYDVALAKWKDRLLLRWAAVLPPERLLVMPSSGGYPDFGRPPTDEALRGVDRFLSLALHLKIRDAVFFGGWGTGGVEEEALDRALVSGCSGALMPPTEDLLNRLDSVQ